MVENINPVTPKPAVAETKPESVETRQAPNRGPRGDRRGKAPFRGKERDKMKETVVSINRVAKVVKGGKHLRFAAIVIIGDNQGKVSFGTGKSGEVPDAIKKATENARKVLTTVKMVKGDTLPHAIIGKYGATRVFLKPAPAGTGIVAGAAVRAILESAGIKNVFSKVYGSRSPINVVRATFDAIKNLKTIGEVAALRGKDLSEKSV